MGSKAKEVHSKRPSEIRKYDMDFADDVVAGDTLSTVTVSDMDATGDITLGSESTSGTVAQVKITGGDDGVTYRVLFSVTTSGGETLSAWGELEVSER